MSQLFIYKGINKKGIEVKGSIASSSVSKAREMLRSMQIIVSDLQIKDQVYVKALSAAALLQFTKETGLLVKAGMTLYDALSLLSAEDDDTGIASVSRGLAEALRKGLSFSDGLAIYPDSFSLTYRSMISAGEASGNIGDMLHQLEKYLEKNSEREGIFFKSMIYPTFITALAILLGVVILTVFIPSLEELLTMSKEKGMITSALLWLSHFTLDYWIFHLIFWGSFIGTAILYKKSILSFFVRNISYVKDKVVKENLSMGFRSLAVLVKNGVPLVEALARSRMILTDPDVLEWMRDAENAVIAGYTLSSVSIGSIVPASVQSLLVVGESTGKLGEMFDSIALLLEKEVTKSIDTLLAVMQPTMILVVAGFIGIVAVAIISPMSSLNFSS